MSDGHSKGYFLDNVRPPFQLHVNGKQLAIKTSEVWQIPIPGCLRGDLLSLLVMEWLTCDFFVRKAQGMLQPISREKAKKKQTEDGREVRLLGLEYISLLERAYLCILSSVSQSFGIFITNGNCLCYGRMPYELDQIGMPGKPLGSPCSIHSFPDFVYKSIHNFFWMSCYVVRGAYDPLPSLPAPCLPFHSNYDQRSFVGEIVPITKKPSPERDSYKLSAYQTPFMSIWGCTNIPNPNDVYPNYTYLNRGIILDFFAGRLFWTGAPASFWPFLTTTTPNTGHEPSQPGVCLWCGTHPCNLQSPGWTPLMVPDFPIIQ